MGADDGDAGEKPAHKVTVAGFYIDRTEVTAAMYTECVRRSQCPPAPTTADWPGIDDEDLKFDSQFYNGGREEHGDRPINCVDWIQADTYCRAIGKRLPTEEEWEYAAPSASLLNALGAECVAMGARLWRPGWKSMYDGSDGWETTATVGSYPAGASPFGVLDMASNVWEFTSSGYSQDYHSQRGNEKRVIRGGGRGYEDPSFVRTTNRGGCPPVSPGRRCWVSPSNRSGCRALRHSLREPLTAPPKEGGLCLAGSRLPPLRGGCASRRACLEHQRSQQVAITLNARL